MQVALCFLEFYFLSYYSYLILFLKLGGLAPSIFPEMSALHRGRGVLTSIIIQTYNVISTIFIYFFYLLFYICFVYEDIKLHYVIVKNKHL